MPWEGDKPEDECRDRRAIDGALSLRLQMTARPEQQRAERGVEPLPSLWDR